VAGATSSPTASHGTPAISLPSQVGAFSFYSGGAADQNALYGIMIGGNDVRDAALYQTGSDATDAITTGVQKEVDEIKVLAGEGAKDFLVVNVPNVGLIPEFTLENPGDAANATAYSISYDSQLSAGLEGLGLPKGDQLTDFNLFAFNANILKTPACTGSRI
jgi:phospholipase/lecithinase/hemolysin